MQANRNGRYHVYFAEHAIAVVVVPAILLFISVAVGEGRTCYRYSISINIRTPNHEISNGVTDLDRGREELG